MILKMSLKVRDAGGKNLLLERPVRVKGI